MMRQVITLMRRSMTTTVRVVTADHDVEGDR